MLGMLCAAVAVLATACGSSGPSAEEQWADKVCTPISDWQGKVTKLVDDVQSEIKSPSAGTPAAVKSSVDKGVTDTKQLVSDLKALPAPPADTENGQTAKQSLTDLGNTLTKSVNDVQAKVKSAQSSESLSQAAAAVTQIASELSAAVAATSTTVDSIKQVSSDLKKGFEDADSCQDLKKQT